VLVCVLWVEPFSEKDGIREFDDIGRRSFFQAPLFIGRKTEAARDAESGKQRADVAGGEDGVNRFVGESSVSPGIQQ
jgi:hypothetical protein